MSQEEQSDTFSEMILKALELIKNVEWKESVDIIEDLVTKIEKMGMERKVIYIMLRSYQEKRPHLKTIIDELEGMKNKEKPTKTRGLPLATLK